MKSTREQDDRCTCGVLIAEHRDVLECAGDPRWPERTEKEIEQSRAEAAEARAARLEEEREAAEARAARLEGERDRYRKGLEDARRHYRLAAGGLAVPSTLLRILDAALTTEGGDHDD